MTATTTTVEKPDRLAETHEQLTAAVEALVTGDDWTAMLTAAAKFHDYSFNNVMLIYCQRPEATHVAGYRRWQSLRRQVRKGEKSIKILAPVIYKRDTDYNTATADDAKPARVLRGFKVASVFDIAQTDGEPIPDVAPVLLTGTAEGWDMLAAQIHAAGYQLDRADCSPANGITNYVTRTVSVRPGLEPAQAIKTLAHELGHVMMHKPEPDVDRRRQEVEAESVAYLVTATLGINAGSYTFPYVARWAAGNTALIAATASRVIETARTITAGLVIRNAGEE